MTASKWAVACLAFVAVGCGQTSMSPTSPAAVSSSVAASAPSAVLSPTAVALQPILAQLGRAGNFLDSANHHLVIVTYPTDPCHSPGDPCFENHLEAALDFYQKANGVLDALVTRIIPTDPCAPAFISAVSGIVQNSSDTTALLANIPGNPIISAISGQVSHTLSLTSVPLACHLDG